MILPQKHTNTNLHQKNTSEFLTLVNFSALVTWWQQKYFKL